MRMRPKVRLMYGTSAGLLCAPATSARCAASVAITHRQLACLLPCQAHSSCRAARHSWVLGVGALAAPPRQAACSRALPVLLPLGRSSSSSGTATSSSLRAMAGQQVQAAMYSPTQLGLGGAVLLLLPHLPPPAALRGLLPPPAAVASALQGRQAFPVLPSAGLQAGCSSGSCGCCASCCGSSSGDGDGDVGGGGTCTGSRMGTAPSRSPASCSGRCSCRACRGRSAAHGLHLDREQATGQDYDGWAHAGRQSLGASEGVLAQSRPVAVSR